MSDLVLVYTLFADAGEARRLSRLLVGEGLAACANMLGPCTSIYEWQGDVREENEFPVLLKTAIEKRAALMARLAELHSYSSEEHTSELQSLMRNSYAVFCLKKTR